MIFILLTYPRLAWDQAAHWEENENKICARSEP